MFSELATTSINEGLEKFTNLDELTQVAQEWFIPMQKTCDKTNRLSKLFFDIKMIKWTQPIVAENTISRSTAEIEFKKDCNIEEYDFKEDIDEEIDEAKEFFKGAHSFGLFFKISAYKAEGQSVPPLCLWVIKPGNEQAAEIKQHLSTLS